MTSPISYAPICLFAYNRVEELSKTINALKNNFLAQYSDLIIYCDGPKSEIDLENVLSVRKFLQGVSGFQSVLIIHSNKNIGLANSIINGVTEQIHKFGRVIVLEDDIVTSRNFLNYMNAALDFYKNNPKVISVSGFSYDLESMSSFPFDNGFRLRMYPWGWGTWLDQWMDIDWDIKDYPLFSINKSSQRQFARGGSDLNRMLYQYTRGRIDSWMIRFLYTQYKKNTLDVFPKISKSINIGFNNRATHTPSSSKRFDATLDASNNILFDFNPLACSDSIINSELKRKHSLIRRIYYRIYKWF